MRKLFAASVQSFTAYVTNLIFNTRLASKKKWKRKLRKLASLSVKFPVCNWTFLLIKVFFILLAGKPFFCNVHPFRKLSKSILRITLLLYEKPKRQSFVVCVFIVFIEKWFKVFAFANKNIETCLKNFSSFLFM